jgi:archaellum biogenesis ATPase FlaH
MTLLQHLSNADSLDYLAREGLLSATGREIIPTEFVARLTEWSLDAFFASGRTVAPSAEAIKDTWADLLEQHEVSIDTDTEPDSVQWAVADLRANHARLQAETLINEFAQDMAGADGPDRVGVFHRYSERMFLTSQSLISRRNEMTGARGVEDALFRLHDRMQTGHITRGITLGIPEIDNHSFGTHPGEITVIGGAPASGKSWLAGFIAYANWDAGRRMLLVTLENDVPMTYDRLCCMACRIDYNAWQRGDVSADARRAAFALYDKMTASEVQPIFAQLELSQRTASGILRKALLDDVDGVIIDQLNFLHTESERKAAKRYEQVGEIMHRLKALANEGAHQLPVILLSQMKREGIAAARKNGKFHMDDYADSSFIEQTADTAWAIYQTADMAFGHEALLQELKARRTVLRDFPLIWRPETGLIMVRPQL